MRYFRTALLFVSLGGTAVAGPFDGLYRQTAETDCTQVGGENGALRIEGGIFYGAELECRMSNPVNVIDMEAKLYTMQCSNEETAWTERAMVLEAAEGRGIIMVWDGYAFQYDACQASDAVTAASEGDG